MDVDSTGQSASGSEVTHGVWNMRRTGHR